MDVLTVEDRTARGKAARERVPRSAHADWAPAARRRSPVRVLGEQDKSRVKELVPVRYGRMLDSAFTFYRGAASIMAMDLGAVPDSGLVVQLCGDAHLSNFGAFQAPDRRLVFDINDFDETLPGPFEWDVKRLAASFEIGGRDRGFKKRRRREAVLGAVGRYREAIRTLAEMRDIDIWYTRVDVEELEREYGSRLSGAEQKRLDKGIAKAKRKDSLRALNRLSERQNGDLRIASRPPVLEPIEDLAEAEGQDAEQISARIENLIAEYRRSLPRHNRRLIERYRYVDAGRKVVGVGSVGTRCWIVLLTGRDDDDPLFLQVKEAGASVLEPYAGASRVRHHGHRVVHGQQLTQAASDVLLGWLTVEGPDGKKRDFYVRQLWDGKASADVESMTPSVFATYGELCGGTLARAHARTGDPIAIAAYLGKSDRFDQAIADFAEVYADQNELDYQALLEAEKAGKVKVLSGV